MSDKKKRIPTRALVKPFESLPEMGADKVAKRRALERKTITIVKKSGGKRASVQKSGKAVE